MARIRTRNKQLSMGWVDQTTLIAAQKLQMAMSQIKGIPAKKQEVLEDAIYIALSKEGQELLKKYYPNKHIIQEIEVYGNYEASTGEKIPEKYMDKVSYSQAIIDEDDNPDEKYII